MNVFLDRFGGVLPRFVSERQRAIGVHKRITFGLNQMTARNLPLLAFMDIAKQIGCGAIELRNDLARPLFDGMAPNDVRAAVSERNLTIAGLAEVYAFNDLTSDRMAQISTLAEHARSVAARAVGLIPRNDGQNCDTRRRQSDLRAALVEIAPVLKAAGVIGLIEPLGFSTASLRYKSDVIDALAATGTQDQFKLVHDTFHHHIAAEAAYYPAQTAIIHVSGVSSPAPAPATMQDRDRVLVDGGDVLGNISQLEHMHAHGFDGVVSFEAFAPKVHNLDDPARALRKSIDYIENARRVMAA